MSLQLRLTFSLSLPSFNSQNEEDRQLKKTRSNENLVAEAALRGRTYSGSQEMHKRRKMTHHTSSSKNEEEIKLKSCLKSSTSCRQKKKVVYRETVEEAPAKDLLLYNEFFKACVKGDLATLESCLQKGVPIDAVRKIKPDKREKGEKLATRNSGPTGLHLAVKHAQLDVVKFFIANHANINLKDRCGMTPFHYSIDGPAQIMGEFLVRPELQVCSKRSYSVSVKNDQGIETSEMRRGTVREYIEAKLSKKIYQKLVDELLNRERKEYLALFNARRRMFEVFLYPTADADVQLVAIAKDYFRYFRKKATDEEVDEFISTHKVRVQAELEVSSQTPWHLMMCFPDFVDLMPVSGLRILDLYSKNARGQTPLHIAAKSFNKVKAETIESFLYKKLVAFGGDKHLPDYEGYTPQDFALDNIPIEESSKIDDLLMKEHEKAVEWSNSQKLEMHYNNNKQILEVVLNNPKDWKEKVYPLLEDFLESLGRKRESIERVIRNVYLPNLMDRIKDELGVPKQTVWHLLACFSDFDKYMALAKKRPEDLNQKNGRGETPLDIAARVLATRK